MNWSPLLGTRKWGFVHLLLISIRLLIQKLLDGCLGRVGLLLESEVKSDVLV